MSTKQSTGIEYPDYYKNPTMRLKRPNRTPRSGFVFDTPDGSMIIGSSVTSLMERVRRHFQINGLQIPENLEAVIHHHLCMRNPHDFCVGEGPRGVSWVGYDEIKKGSLALLETMKAWMKHGRALIPIEEAETRARLCNNCSKNSRTNTCWTCTELYKAMERFFRGRKTTVDNTLQICKVCKCANKAHIHMPIDILAKVTDLKMLEPSNEKPGDPDDEHFPKLGCWKRTELEKYYARGQVQ